MGVVSNCTSQEFLEAFVSRESSIIADITAIRTRSVEGRADSLLPGSRDAIAYWRNIRLWEVLGISTERVNASIAVTRSVQDSLVALSKLSQPTIILTEDD